MYLAEIEERFPGALASQRVPTDPKLWHVDRYLDFLAERRILLAAAANALMGDLLHDTPLGPRGPHPLIENYEWLPVPRCAGEPAARAIERLGVLACFLRTPFLLPCTRSFARKGVRGRRGLGRAASMANGGLAEPGRNAGS